MNTGKQISTHYGALDAFFPAVLARSGDLDRARRLQESSYKMWTTFGIEPEELDYSTMKLVAPGYALRPEIIESAYYLQFYTKDPRYQEMGSTFILSLVRYCKTEAGYAALGNVETKTKKDSMESYFLAETMKYLYLLFAPRETLDLDKVIFNTEAHPIRKTW
jgi:mannosidase alpha-like ER degradation enhancer 2